MKAPTPRPVTLLSGVVLAVTTSHWFSALAIGLVGLVLFIFSGIALPAVWSASSARRTAAAEVLKEILNIFRRQ